jgi:antitoxin YefM
VVNRTSILANSAHAIGKNQKFSKPKKMIISKKEEKTMTIKTFQQAETNFNQLIEEVATSHQPVIITGEKYNAVLISQEDWYAIQETLYLLSIPGMRESIKEGLATPVEECDEELDW